MTHSSSVRRLAMHGSWAWLEACRRIAAKCPAKFALTHSVCLLDVLKAGLHKANHALCCITANRPALAGRSLRINPFEVPLGSLVIATALSTIGR